jgi:hypothetical protein
MAVLILAACLLGSFVCVAYPMYVIRPFRAQGARELALALAIMRVRPVVTVISALVSIATVFWSSRRQARKLAIVMAALVCVLAVLARVNVYEKMFHPLDHPAFAAASEVKLDKDEKVIAVKLGSEARAYPIRGMSYHHVINDVLNNEPIVATY